VETQQQSNMAVTTRAKKIIQNLQPVGGAGNATESATVDVVFMLSWALAKWQLEKLKI